MENNLPIHTEIANFSKLLATNFKNKRITPISDSVYLEIDRVGAFNKKDQFLGVASAIANKLYPEVLLYKSRIVPYMTRLSNFIKERSESIKGKNQALEYTITNSTFSNLVDEIIKANSSVGGDPLDLYNEDAIEIPYSDIKALFKFNNSTYNIYLENILKNKTDEQLLDIYGKYLTGISKNNTMIKNLYNVNIASISMVDTIILIIAALENYISNSEPGVIEPNDKKTLDLYKMNLIKVLKKIKPHYENVSKIELVILYKDGKNIIVDDNNYNKFLKAGGTPDAVLGWMIEDSESSDLTKRTIKGLMSGKEKYEEAWNKFVNFSKLAVSDQLLESVRTFMHMEFNKVWDEYVPEDLKDEIDMESARDKYHKLIAESSDLLLKPSALARVLMSDVFFSHTNFKLFADTMKSYLETDSKITYQDAATFTIIDMVITYLCNQLEVS